MIESNKFDRKLKRIYYFYPSELAEPPVKVRIKLILFFQVYDKLAINEFDPNSGMKNFLISNLNTKKISQLLLNIGDR